MECDNCFMGKDECTCWCPGCGMEHILCVCGWKPEDFIIDEKEDNQ